MKIAVIGIGHWAEP